MRRIVFIMVASVAVCFATRLPVNVDYIDGSSHRQDIPPLADRALIATSGDVRSILGPQGKSIAVSGNGNAIAVIYGDPTTDPTSNCMEISIAYSLDDGQTWTNYGPFSPEVNRIYPGLDGTLYFDWAFGQLYFTWQESPYEPPNYISGDLKIMIEEGTPSSSSPSTPVSLPDADNITPWLGSIAVNPDNQYYVVVTGWSLIPSGDRTIFSWVSEDGGYTWSDTGRVVDPINIAGCGGHLRFGSGGYMIYTYQDLYNFAGTDIIYPYYVESTDGGYSWGEPVPCPEVPLIDPSNVGFWWHELDGEVINNEPWLVHNDINNTTSDQSGFWIFHGTAGPGEWNWDVINFDDFIVDTIIGDSSYAFAPGQYPSVAYDRISGTILVTCKANYIKSYVPDSDTVVYGAHIGGIYSTDNGDTWTVTQPLSTEHLNAIPWSDWNATETAHRLVNKNGTIHAYSVWINETSLNTYFEKGIVEKYLPECIEEMNDHIACYGFDINPNIATDYCDAIFNMPDHGIVALRLFNTNGRLIEEVFSGNLDKGNQSIRIRTANLAAGTYFVVLETENSIATRKLIKLY